MDFYYDLDDHLNCERPQIIYQLEGHHVFRVLMWAILIAVITSLLLFADQSHDRYDLEN